MSNKPVAKTPDVREELARVIKEYDTLCDEYNSGESPYCWSTETVINKVLESVQPLIEAAEIRGAEKERAKDSAEEEEAREAGEFIQIINRYEDGE